MKKPKSKKVDLRKEIVPSDAPHDTMEHEDGMQGKTKNDAYLQQMRNRMSMAYNWWRPIYDMSVEDVNFAYVNQWPQEVQAQRKNRPMLTLNMIPEYINQVMGKARQSKFSVKIRQISGKNDNIRVGGKTSNYSRSEVIEGLIRDIEYRSKAHRAYCRSMQHAVEGGIGWLRIRTVRPVDDPFSIELRIEHVKDRYSVLLDPFTNLEDFSDARFAGIYHDMPTEEFEARWPEIPASAWSAEPGGRHGKSAEGSYWGGAKDHVRIVDYWWKEPMKREAIELIRQERPNAPASRFVVYKDEVEDVIDELKEQGYKIVQQMKVDSYKVMYMRAVSNHTLEEPTEWPSTMLPVVPLTGRRVNLEDHDAFIGLTRYAKDPQRMYNFWSSSATEKVALAPKNPWLVTAAMIAGHEKMWDEMSTSNRAYVIYNGDEETGVPIRQQGTTLATGELQLVGQSKMALQDSVGLHDTALGRGPSDQSGVAIERKEDQGSNSTFDFVDNTTSSVETVGDILADMIPRVYTNDQARTLILPDDSSLEIELNNKIVDEETGNEFYMNTLDYARFSCRATVGPASATQRQNFANMMLEWGRSDPEGMQIFRDVIVDALDLPNGRVVVERFKKLVPRHLLSPEDQEKIPPSPPTPEQQLEAKDLEVRNREADAKMAKAESDIKVAELRVGSDQARTEFEVEKGLNRQEKEMETEKGGNDEAQIESVVKRVVAKALAEKKKSN